MKKVLILALFVALSSIPALAQDDYNKFELFAGYSHNRVDLNLDDDPDEEDVFDELDERVGFNGFNAAVTGNISRYVGLKFDVSGHWHSDNFTVSTTAGPQRVDFDTTLWNFLGGVQIKDNASTSTVKPFAHALVGAGHISTEFAGSPAVGSAITEADLDDTGFAAVIGGGLDIRAGDNLDVRLIQFDYNPNRFSDETFHNFRIGVGIVFH
jgi:opacity protein-like surface antigen